jgi:hypothetical protein
MLWYPILARAVTSPGVEVKTGSVLYSFLRANWTLTSETWHEFLAGDTLVAAEHASMTSPAVSEGERTLRATAPVDARALDRIRLHGFG